MYLVSEHKGLDARRVAVTEMKLEASTAMKVEKVEVHGSSFTDPGPDFCRHVAYDGEGREVAVRTTEGY